MPAFDQATRFIEVTTPLGDNKVVLQSFSGKEEMSRLFAYQLDLISEDDALDPSAIVGHEVAVRIDQDDNADRYFHGIVREFSPHRLGRAGLELPGRGRPAALDADADERLPHLPGEVDAADYRRGLRRRRPQGLRAPPVRHVRPREYCVQYRETDFNFVSRLMEEEGIFYYFKHEKSKHTLVLSDSPNGYFKLPEYNAEFLPPTSTSGNQVQVKDWRTRTHSGREVRSDRLQLRDPQHRPLVERVGPQGVQRRG